MESPGAQKGHMLLVPWNNFDLFSRPQPVGLIFPLARRSFWGRAEREPRPSPFPFSSYSGFWGHFNLALPSEHKSRGRSSGLFEKHEGTLQSLSRGTHGEGRAKRHKEKVPCGSFNHRVEGERRKFKQSPASQAKKPALSSTV